MPAVTLRSSSASLANSLLLHQNVTSVSTTYANYGLNSLTLGWFATKIFHPNVSSAGEICVNTLKKDWQSSFGIAHILVTVKCLLIYPNPESALDEEAGKLLLENYDSYSSRAKLITSVHATPAVCAPPFSHLCRSRFLTLTMLVFSPHAGASFRVRYSIKTRLCRVFKVYKGCASTTSTCGIYHHSDSQHPISHHHLKGCHTDIICSTSQGIPI